MSAPVSSYAAVAFDLDGTLVDTLPIHYEAYRIVLAAVGCELTRERFEAGIGGPARDAIPRFVDMSSIPRSRATARSHAWASLTRAASCGAPRPRTAARAVRPVR